MTTASSRPVNLAVAPQPTIAVTWAIARDAACQALPDLELLPSPSRGGDVLLCITVSGRACSAELRDTHTGATHPIEFGRVEIEALRADEFLHITAREGHTKVLAVTMRDQGSTQRVLYATTSLLDRLGIRGGRYTRPTLAD